MSDQLAAQKSEWKKLDLAHCWHPFTQQQEWSNKSEEILSIETGKGVWLTDHDGHEYIDGNASIWTNIHGHAHPTINAAIIKQLGLVSHSSFLGFTHPLAGLLAKELIDLVSDTQLNRVFYSDDGSTAIECAMKMELQYRQQNNQPNKTAFIAFDQAYHGDTMGAASLGGVAIFHEKINNKTAICHQVKDFEQLVNLDLSIINEVCAVVIEPIIQGVNEMRPWPKGTLKQLRAWCDKHDIHLILDEVMTGFGRTGTMFAYQQEAGASPDYVCLAKGLTAGYMPMAATLTTERIYEAFLGETAENKTFYYGHSYTANPLGCAAALASLQVFKDEQTLRNLPEKIQTLERQLTGLKNKHPQVYEVRQYGMITGIELRQADGHKFNPASRIGHEVCLAARKYKLLTRPILDTIVLLPPLAISSEEISQAIEAISQAIEDVMNSKLSG